MNKDLLRQVREKLAYAPPPPPPGDPMAAGMTPEAMDPAMMGGGMPPMDPAMMAGGMPPMDPAMMAGGKPPMDPAMMAGGMPPVQVNLEDLKAILQMATQGDSGEPGESEEESKRVTNKKLMERLDELQEIIHMMASVLDIPIPQQPSDVGSGEESAEMPMEPPMDPMAGGMPMPMEPPMDPMAGGMPPMDPAMMGGGMPPVDPMMMPKMASDRRGSHSRVNMLDMCLSRLGKVK